MIMRSLPRMVLAVFVSLVLLAPIVCSQQKGSEKIHIVGTVIGRWKAGGMLVMPGGPIPEFILVRVDEPSGNIQTGQYIFARYSYSLKEEEKLPKNFYKQISQWRFTLKRIEGYDGPMRDILYSKSDRERDGTMTPLMEFVPGAETESLPLNVVVPLYEVELGSIEK